MIGKCLRTSYTNTAVESVSAMSDPRISVILPVYNNEQYLGEAIDSILKQTYVDFELIIITEFGSSAKSIEIVDSYKDRRMTIIKNGHRLGLARSLNLGLELAKGDYIARMDADDVSEPSRFGLQVDYLDHNPKVAVCGSYVITIDRDGKAIERAKYPVEPLVVKWSMFILCAIGHSSIMARKEALHTMGGYRENAKQAEDYDLWMRILREYEIANVPQFLHKRRHHESNVSISKREELKESASKYLKESLELYMQKEIPLDPIRNILFADRLDDEEDVIHAIDALNELRTVFIKRESPNEHERKLILEQYDFCAGNIIGSLLVRKPSRMLPLLIRSKTVTRQFWNRKGQIDILRAIGWKFKSNRSEIEWN